MRGPIKLGQVGYAVISIPLVQKSCQASSSTELNYLRSLNVDKEVDFLARIQRQALILDLPSLNPE
jgi:hypothetical protein